MFAHQFKALERLPRHCWKHCFGPETGQLSGEALCLAQLFLTTSFGLWYEVLVFHLYIYIYNQFLRRPGGSTLQLLLMRPQLKGEHDCSNSFWHWCHAVVPISVGSMDRWVYDADTNSQSHRDIQVEIQLLRVRLVSWDLKQDTARCLFLFCSTATSSQKDRKGDQRSDRCRN